MKRTDGFILQSVGGENMLVPVGSRVVDLNGMVILNKTGRFVWELLAEDRSIEDLAAALAQRFDVDPERARADIQVFLNNVAHIGLVAQ